MTIFITESFKLDLSHLKIKFSEENSFFEKGLIKQYSFPFKIPRERSFIPFFQFISDHNSIESNRYVKGTLFRNDRYYDAELLITGVSKGLEVVIYYNTYKLDIMGSSLRSLPWGTIEAGNDIHTFAAQTVLKDYPDTPVNFVEVYAPDRYKDYEFGNGQYAGFINHNVNGVFQDTVYEVFGISFARMNEMRPFLYLKEVVQFIFSQIGYTVTGDLMTNASINKCLLYHDNPIFYTNNDYERGENLILTLLQANVSGYTPNYLTYNEYAHAIVMNSYGTYKVKVSVEGDIQAAGEECYIRCYFNNTLLATAIARDAGDFTREFSFDFNVGVSETGNAFEIRVIATDATKATISGEFEITGTLRPLYRSYISIKDLVPDITVEGFINAVKESFNMATVFDPATQTVRFDFFTSFVDGQSVLDLSKFAMDVVPRSFNKSVGYKIPFSDGEVLNLSREGEFVTEEIGFTEEKPPLEPLPVVYIDGEAGVKHQDGLSVLFFQSNSDANPLVIDGNISYSRLGFVHTFLRNWYYQNLNSEEYNLTLNLPIYISSKLNADSKVWLYNNYFIVRSLKRSTISSLFETISLRLFKLKNVPTFNLVITDPGGGNSGGGTTYEPPVAVTTISAAVNTPATQYSATIQSSPFGGPSSFYVDIPGNHSSDPQGLPLSFSWEVISSPDGNASGIFQAQNPEHSVTRFSNSGYINLAGNYVIRLTVVNSVGLSDTIDVTVTVS
ncbi:PKD domain-containing protein [Leptobacterium sp. I13]|uniref:PKD domain-containing protein n=1 Tax=Leptobacterium meishanense TaxID=3128904 RepID=UPI0030ECA6E5